MKADEHVNPKQVRRKYLNMLLIERTLSRFSKIPSIPAGAKINKFKFKFKFKKCSLTHNTWYSNLNNRPQCIIKIKETDKCRKKASRWHISRYIKYISRKTERTSISGSTLNQVWHIWVSLQLNDYASQRGLETLMGLCATCMSTIILEGLRI